MNKLSEEEIIEELRNKNAELRDELEIKNAELNKEKEKNETLEALLLGNTYERNKYYKEVCNSILKDKIRAKIEELIKEGDYRTIDNPTGRIHFHNEPVDYQIQVLQELLEEEE